MKLKRLRLYNFRVFKGEHTLYLETEPKQNKNIVMIGGLNGAGKTSVLTAIRLAILGKNAFEGNISHKNYNEELKGFIYTSDKFLAADEAFVEVEFSFVKFGESQDYRVRRQWTTKPDTEGLLVFQNNVLLTELTIEQAQSFLLDMVPPGVAELFFFDGEKIKELAESTDDVVLSDAFKKMIGVDFIERAITDLQVLARTKRQNKSDLHKQQQIEELKHSLVEYESSISQHLDELGSLRIKYAHEQKELEQIEGKLKGQGGDWAVSREEMIKQLSTLETEKRLLSAQVADTFKGNLAFVVANNFFERLLIEAEKTHLNYANTLFNEKLKTKLKKLSLTDSLDVDVLLNNLAEPEIHTNLSYVTPESLHKLKTLQNNRIRDKNAVKNLLIRIEKLNQQIDDLERNLSRVPDQDTLVELYDHCLNQQQRVFKLDQEIQQIRAQGKEAVQKAIDVTRTLDKLTKSLVVDEKNKHAEQLIVQCIATLKEIMLSLTRLKVDEVEKFFAESFARMTRKEDFNLSVKINPATFAISLHTPEGSYKDKKQLSAGEKQIYALAMIEAMGKASDRKLPLIIDTPLGRLDSVHRTNIVNHFFPKANDQVIILSTDTEVDEQYFGDITQHIRSNYTLSYDNIIGSTVVNDGYFWESKNAH